MEHLGENGKKPDYSAYELPDEYARDSDVVRMSTNKFVRTRDMPAYQDSYVAAQDDDSHERTLEGIVATGTAVGIGLAILAYAKHKKKNH